jgi:type I restriction enzyme M protein
MSNTGALGFEEKLFKAADKLRKNMDAAEYKHIVLGLIFLKFVSDAFLLHRRNLEAELSDPAQGLDEDAIQRTLEDRDEYAGSNVFWIPVESRWETLRANATQTDIGKRIDDALYRLEQEYASLKGVFTRNYARPSLESRTLAELINLFSNDLDFTGDHDSTSDTARDIVGRVYEYCLEQFASLEGKRGGQFYTPPHVVRVIIEMLEPFQGRVFDPCCGSGGMFVQSREFIRNHQAEQRHILDKPGKKGISIFGQESNETTWRLCMMNLAIHGIDGNIQWNPEGSFLRDAHPDLRADFVMANPPFNDSDWSGELLRDDPRWVFGIPPSGNANYAWIQHFFYHLGPEGYAGFVMANGSLSSQQSGEGNIREQFVRRDYVDCIVSLPGQLFYSTGIPVSLWFLAKRKDAPEFRDRRGETLFINATKLGYLRDRTNRVLSDEDISLIANTYHRWRGTLDDMPYEDVGGFCKSECVEKIAEHDYVLTPGRYVGAVEKEVDGEPFAVKFARLRTQLDEQFDESIRLQERIRANLQSVGTD